MRKQRKCCGSSWYLCACTSLPSQWCMRVRVRVYACMRACVHACMRACVHACMRACVHACMCVCVKCVCMAMAIATRHAFVWSRPNKKRCSARRIPTFRTLERASHSPSTHRCANVYVLHVCRLVCCMYVSCMLCVSSAYVVRMLHVAW